MLDRLFAGLQADAPAKLIAATLERLDGQPCMVVLDALYSLLRDGLANSPGSAAAQRWVDAITPAAEQWVTRALAELAAGEDNPVRRDLSGKRLTLLADQLAHACYVEALRAAAEVKRGGGRGSSLLAWATGYFHWLGCAHTARALLDCHAELAWDGICSLYDALLASGVLAAEPEAASREPALSLAYLLLVHDSFYLLGEQSVAAGASIINQLAPKLVLAADFHYATPLLLTPDTGLARRVVGWAGAGEIGTHLYYGVDEVVKHAEALALDAQAGHPPPWLRGVVDAASLINKLIDAWTRQPGRLRNPALRQNQQAHAAFDWMRIRGLLGQKTARLPAHDPLISQVKLDDADEGGASMLVDEALVPLFHPGVVALRIGGRWWLARPVRAEPEPDGRWFIVVRWLAQEADPARVISQSGQSWRAVYLHPGPANSYRLALLIDSDQLALGQRCFAELGEQTLALLPASIDQLGPALWRYTCTLYQEAH
ncbi:hypothetical protein [Chitinimonas sp.]|uniref:hypothetical protein n=1 Tax=Chitinimonas sp. TaxID=1934313 RepID=UPI0035B28346